MPCFNNGDKVHWKYRSAIGHGTVTGVHRQGKTCQDTMYSIHEIDHHVSATGSHEPATVYHFGAVLNHDE